MTCEACRKALEVEEDRVNSINRALDQPCGCEGFSVSEHSPGPVRDDEVMHFLASLPNSRLESGHINPQYLTQLDQDGLSVLRDGASDSEFKITLDQLMVHWKEREKSLEGVISFSAAQIRAAKDPRLCCIYDTGEKERPHHAELMTSDTAKCFPNVAANQMKKAKKERLREIMELIGNAFTPAKDFRGGKFLED